MQEKKNGELRHKILTIIGIALCVILTPMLIINCTLLIKGAVNKDEVPSFGNLFPLIVLTGSMENDFPAGSLIFCSVAEAGEIKEGDIIAYFDPASRTSAVVTHMVRFIQTDEKGETIFLTYGTANTSKSFEEVTEGDCEKIPADKLIGIYTGVHLKGVGNVAMFMQTTPGLIICVFIPLVALLGYDIIRRKMYEKKHEGDKEEMLRELEQLRVLKAQAMAVVARSEAASVPAAQANSAPQENPAEQEAPAPQPKPTLQVRPVTQASPAAEEKPAETPEAPKE